MTFEEALVAIRNGANYRMSGSSLQVDGEDFTVTDEQFDLAWDAMNEAEDAADSMIALVDEAGAAVSPQEATGE